MSTNTFWDSPKDPSDRRRYEADFADVLPAGQSIAAILAVELAGGLTAPTAEEIGGGDLSGQVSGEPSVLFAWAAGGTAGGKGVITWRVRTSANEVIERSVVIPITQR